MARTKQAAREATWAALRLSHSTSTTNGTKQAVREAGQNAGPIAAPKKRGWPKGKRRGRRNEKTLVQMAMTLFDSSQVDVSSINEVDISAIQEEQTISQMAATFFDLGGSPSCKKTL